jgi:starch synthase (maltosyl-transferring)
VSNVQGTGGPGLAPPRIYYLHHRLVGGLERFPAALERVAELGFTEVLIPPPFRPGPDGDVFHPIDHGQAAPWLGAELSAGEAIARIAAACRAVGLRLLIDLDLTRFAAGHPLVGRWPDAFAIRRRGEWTAPVDPRRPPPPRGLALARLDSPHASEALSDWADAHIADWIEAGAQGFRLLRTDGAPPAFWRGRIQRARALAPGLMVIADASGLPREAALALEGCGVDRLVSSLPWWDARARWLAEEHEDLRLIAPLLGAPEAPFALRLAEHVPADADLHAAYAGRLLLAAALGAGLMVPMGFEYGARERLEPAAGRPEDFEHWRRQARFDLAPELKVANAVTSELERLSGEMRILTPVDSPAAAVLLTDTSDAREAERGLLALVNADFRGATEIRPSMFLSGAGSGFGRFERLGGGAETFEPLAPGEVRCLLARRERPITTPARPARTSALTAANQPRIVIDRVSPRVDGGPYPVKRIVGEAFVVEADIIAEGHTALAVELQWRAADDLTWRTVKMTSLGNDRWRAAFDLERIGRWDYAVEAWIDEFGGYRDGLVKKLAAGVAAPVDFEEGRLLVEAAAGRAEGGLKAELQAVLTILGGPCSADRGALLTAQATAELMSRADERPFLVRGESQAVDAERLSARFASWYELFPRSQTDDPARHGDFEDVIARLPDIRAMGFDVLYFPPIHPIGRTSRKGRDNRLEAGPEDPGSPYGIGSAEGGHTAIHPDLGTLEDFQRLLAAAREHGLEIALDFAIQCSPDHPWLSDQPGWFDWRPDGTVKHAENPPKTYEDIVNVDFYAPDAVPGLWCALRDVVLFWVKQGVKTFRVDNPHTKPLPFWEWLISDVRRTWPEVIFLAEAFTRPKLMYRLAKLGFSQSYTYFTWRHSKQEFTDYLLELTTTAPREFFRPHFFVNTPDINPYFLQASGRAGFLIRAALAATLSGLWGVYSGFELLEAEPVPGREEYHRSEKYEIKPRDWRAPGNIRGEIARLNRVRRGEPALQSHLNITFYNAFNDQVLYFGKALPGERDRVLVAISLDPHHPQEADFEIPLWEWGLPDTGALDVCDLVHDRSWIWHGKRQRLSLTPHEPYGIWRVQPAETA